MAYTDGVICMHQRPLTLFASPGRYVQGQEATYELGRELKRLGFSGRVILIAGGTAQRLLQPIWTSVLPAEGIDPVVLPFAGECSGEEINRLVNLAQGQGAVAIVGAGGGKASDTARAVADELNLPVIITPTLASTDSPCSALSVLYGNVGSAATSSWPMAPPPAPRSTPCTTASPPSPPSSTAKNVAFGLLTQLVLEERPQSDIEAIYRDQKAVGLPITLAQVGVDASSDDQLRAIAERSVIPGESSHNEPFPVTADALISALRAADQLGRAFI